MTSDWLSDDDRLLDELRQALRVTGDVPADVLTTAEAAIRRRTLEEELALLTYDSVHDAELAGAFRAQVASVHSLEFEHGDVLLAIDVTSDSVVGQVTPATAGRVVVETPAAKVAEASIDELGMFVITAALAGSASVVHFQVVPQDGPPFTTEWTRL